VVLKRGGRYPMTEYEKLLNETIDNSLLHLWITVSVSHRFVSIQNRNNILIKYLKPKVKGSRYKPMKNELRSLLAIGRHSSGDMEQRLLQLKDLTIKHQCDDVSTLYTWLNRIYDEFGVESKLWESTEDKVEGVLYMRRESIERVFSDDNQQLSMLPMFFRRSGNKRSALDKS
jgi:predicted transport protein